MRTPRRPSAGCDGWETEGVATRVRLGAVDRRPTDARRDAAIVMDGTALRDEIVAGLRDDDRGGRIAAGVPGHGARRRRPAEPALRAEKQRQGRARRDAVAQRRAAGDGDAGQVEAAVAELAADPDVHGILVQLPLPDGLDADAVLALVPVDKDVDGLTERSLGRLVRGEPGLVPCTPLGVMRLLERYEVPIAGERAVVVGRSTLVGLPIALLLARKGVDATVTIAHSRTPDLAAVCREADILVAAAGQARMITADHVKPGAAVIDVGVSRTEAGSSATSTSTRSRGCRMDHADARRNRTDDRRLPAGEHPPRCAAPGPVDLEPRRPTSDATVIAPGRDRWIRPWRGRRRTRWRLSASGPLPLHTPAIEAGSVDTGLPTSTT